MKRQHYVVQPGCTFPPATKYTDHEVDTNEKYENRILQSDIAVMHRFLLPNSHQPTGSTHEKCGSDLVSSQSLCSGSTRRRLLLPHHSRNLCVPLEHHDIVAIHPLPRLPHTHTSETYKLKAHRRFGSVKEGGIVVVVSFRSLLTRNLSTALRQSYFHHAA